jgi:hypothetical protein
MRHFGKVVATVWEEPGKYWSWREELNLQPVVYKLGQVESDHTQEDSSQGKNKEPEDSSP